VLAKLLTAGVAPNGDTILLLTMGNLEDCRSRFCSSSLSSDRFRSSLKSLQLMRSLHGEMSRLSRK
jgi:hypothetical protein